jgi:hypothetical protein
MDVMFLVAFAALGVWYLLAALLLKLGKVEPGRWWGPSPIFNLLMGIGVIALGIGDVIALVVGVVAMLAAMCTMGKPWRRKPG